MKHREKQNAKNKDTCKTKSKLIKTEYMKLYPAGSYPQKSFGIATIFFVRDRDAGKDVVQFQY